MKTYYKITGLLFAYSLAIAPAGATLSYYLPFDDGTSATLANYGSVGGSATPTGSEPTVSTNVPSGLGSVYSERTTSDTTRITLPDSTSSFRLDGPGQAMTISTWIYQDASVASYSDFLETKDSSSGWLVSITNTGAVRMQVISSADGEVNRSSTDAVVPVQTWVNLTLTYDTSAITGSEILTMYINGTRVFTGDTVRTVGTNANPIAIRGSGAQVILDDFAMWDTRLGVGEIRALTTAPAALSGFNVGVLNPLFTAHETASATPVIAGGIVWTYATNMDVTSKALGDVWQSGENYYMWLGGDAAEATGLIGVSSIPEPATVSLILGALSVGLVVWQRRRRA